MQVPGAALTKTFANIQIISVMFKRNVKQLAITAVSLFFSSAQGDTMDKLFFRYNKYNTAMEDGVLENRELDSSKLWQQFDLYID